MISRRLYYEYDPRDNHDDRDPRNNRDPKVEFEAHCVSACLVEHHNEQ